MSNNWLEILIPFPFILFLNAVQSQSGTIVDVVYKRFPLWIITKVGHNNNILQTDTWEEEIQG
jgi:hypothetical protein